MFSGDGSYPSSEKLYDYELGYNYSSPRFSAGVNLYYMKYKDQLIATGMVNDGDDALNVNVPDSYRRGIELTASWRIAGWFTASANATFSQNKIEDYVDGLKDSPTFGQNLGDMTISYSPDALWGRCSISTTKGSRRYSIHSMSASSISPTTKSTPCRSTVIA